MRFNADFGKRIVIRPNNYQWVKSPVPGVERMMLDRIGDEIARATSLVQYTPNSQFSAHSHPGGEELLVLQGSFADEYGEYTAGSYLRNPIGSSHSPVIGDQGCTIFVKLGQFAKDDIPSLCIDTKAIQWNPGMVEGLSVLPLHEYKSEHCALVKWEPNTSFSAHRHWGGEEIMVLQGTFYDDHGVYPKGSWLRSPHLSEHAPYTKSDGALIYVKTGHLLSEIL
jgi:anti-sigma factor ChrR (cupin superfamily)